MSVLKRTITRWTQPFSPDKKFSIATRKVIGAYSYTQTDLLGEGFSSSVYKGKNNTTQQQVAIKVINMKAFRKDQVHIDMLQSEIEILKSVTNQPHILHLYATYTTKNNIYIITECCETDLSKILKTKGKFELKQAIDIISQVLSGYLHLSQSGFIHRDLKPANIFYQNGFYMIGDFGFAVLARTIKSTNNDYNVGSPLYMAPESLQNNKYNFSTDMWSIGIILYEMIKGKTPWYAADESALYTKIKNKPISKMLVDIPIECREFIQRCLNVDAKERLSPAEASQWLNYFIELVNKYDQQDEIHSPLLTKQKSPTKQSEGEKKSNRARYQSPMHRSASVNYLAKRAKSPVQVKTTNVIVQSGEQINQPNTPTIFDKPVQFKIRILYYYCKFLQRIILILTSPLPYQFPSSQSLERYLINLLVYKAERLYNLSPSNNWCKFARLQQYTKNPNKQLQKAIDRVYTRYKQQYQVDNKFPVVELTLIQKSIHQLKKYLEEDFDDKSILLMDYLTTLYQLFRLEQRYDVNKFCCISKLDTIMERNPTEISKQHLERLVSKVIILGI